MATKTEKVDIEKRREEYYNERVPYFARKPEGLAKSETHFTVTVNGKNYRYAYDMQIMIPRFIREVLESQAQMQRKADERVTEFATNGGGGVSLGTY